MAYLTRMKKLLTWSVFILMLVSLLASTQPVTAEGGIIGTPAVPPDPGTPTLLYSGCGGEVVSAQNRAYEQQVIDLINQERTGRGRTPLQNSEGLTRAARYHAADMSQDDYFHHSTWDWVNGKQQEICDPWKRIANYYSGAIGETIAAGYQTPAAVVQGWMNSDKHRDIILKPETRAIGIGFYDYYWVADFGTQVDTLAAAALGDLPGNLVFHYSIPDQKLVPSYMDITLKNVGNGDTISWLLDQDGSFFSATPGNGTTPTSVRITPHNFNQNKVATLSGSIIIDATAPDSVEGAPHTSQVILKVVKSPFRYVFLPGVHR